MKGSQKIINIKGDPKIVRPSKRRLTGVKVEGVGLTGF